MPHPGNRPHRVRRHPLLVATTRRRAPSGRTLSSQRRPLGAEDRANAQRIRDAELSQLGVNAKRNGSRRVYPPVRAKIVLYPQLHRHRIVLTDPFNTPTLRVWRLPPWQCTLARQAMNVGGASYRLNKTSCSAAVSPAQEPKESAGYRR